MTALVWILSALVLPAVWGNLAYRLVEMCWPRSKSADSETKPVPREAPRRVDFPDYQI
jgi:hypothetical protein